MTGWAPRVGFDISACPNLLAHHGRIGERSAVREVRGSRGRSRHDRRAVRSGYQIACGRARRYRASGARLPPSAELGRHRAFRLPSVEFIRPGPCVDLAGADLAFESARMLVLMLLPCRGIIHPAIGAGKIFDRPDAVSHGAIMRRIGPGFQPKPLLPSTTCYPELRIPGPFGNVFLTFQNQGRG